MMMLRSLRFRLKYYGSVQNLRIIEDRSFVHFVRVDVKVNHFYKSLVKEKVLTLKA